MSGRVRRLAPVLVVACLAGACPAIAGAWGPARSGGLGHQSMRGGAGADYLRGAEGPDTLRGNGGGDLLTGDTGPDGISGGSGGDTISGGAGNDIMLGGPGNDIAFGGFGADTIRGDTGDDALDGNNDHDRLSGGDGNDVLHGGSGIDTLEGGDGNDRIFSDSGSDTIDAGAGNDTIVVDGESKVHVNCGDGSDVLYLSVTAEATADYSGRGVSAYYSRNCEAVWLTDALPDPNKGITYLALDAGGKREGTARDDTLLGGPGSDALQGSAGNDVLWGLRQPDVKSIARDYLLAGPGDDTVYGGPGRQLIDGGPGDDFLESGIGNGTIKGGTGNDTIRLRGGGLTKVDAGTGNDTIYARGTAHAQITCGSGRDVAHADAGDRVARDCERIIGSAKRSRARLRATYADTIRATPGLVHWFRLGENAPLGYNVPLVDQISSSSGAYYGELAAPGVTDDGDTAFQSNTNFYIGDPSVSLGIFDAVLHDEFTFEAWYRSADSNTQRGLLSDAPYGSSQGIFIVREIDNSLRAIIISGNSSQNVDLRTPPLYLDAESWHHVALTRADGRIAIYVDGVVKAETPANPITFTTQNYGVGVGTRIGSYKGWEGGIDEIAIYDRALDAATVDEHFRAEDDGTVPVARAEPALPPVLPRAGVIRLKTDRAGASFRCALDSTGFIPCKADYPLLSVPDGQHELLVHATSRTGVRQATPTVLRFAVDASLPSTIVALRLAPDGDGRAIATFGSDSAARYECRFARNTFGRDLQFTPCAAPMDLAPDSVMEVRAIDSAGNADPTPAFAQVPPAGIGFNFGPVLPTFAGARAEARLSGEFSFGPNFQCRIDGHAWSACPSQFRLPLLDPGIHTLQMRQPIGGGAIATTAPMVWSVTPRPGDVAIAGLQLQLVIERSARLLRRAPRVRFALSHPAAVRIDVLKRRKRMISVTASGRVGANIVKIPARKLNGLGEGRYTVRVAVRGATGRIAVQELPLAIVPPLR